MFQGASYFMPHSVNLHKYQWTPRAHLLISAYLQLRYNVSTPCLSGVLSLNRIMMMMMRMTTMTTMMMMMTTMMMMMMMMMMICMPIPDLASHRALRSSAREKLLVPWARSVLERRRAFSVIDLSTWNELLFTLRLLPRNNVSSVYKILKSFLFHRSWAESASEWT